MGRGCQCGKGTRHLPRSCPWTPRPPSPSCLHCRARRGTCGEGTPPTQDLRKGQLQTRVPRAPVPVPSPMSNRPAQLLPDTPHFVHDGVISKCHSRGQCQHLVEPGKAQCFLIFPWEQGPLGCSVHLAHRGFRMKTKPHSGQWRRERAPGPDGAAEPGAALAALCQ